MLDRIKHLKNWQYILLIALVGLAVFSFGFPNQFQGDDNPQIVDNVPVHSISNIKQFFENGTFYVGRGSSEMSGVNYRPLMSTSFSALYTVFGPNPVYFHVFQLLFAIGGAAFLFLFLRYTFQPGLALFLSLVILVHPIDSQVVFAIPSLQDVMYFFFGMLALYLLVRTESVRALPAVALCLFLSLLSKEAGIVFVAISLVYAFWWNRKRLLPFAGILIVPVGLWLALRIHAVGVATKSTNGPIDHLSLAERLLNSPSIFQFYIAKFISPWKLASAYHWTYKTFDFQHVLFPLMVDVLVLGGLAFGAYKVRQKASRSMFYTYLFFGLWFAMGMFATLQIAPLDMTACETWFYFPMVGLLGMLGIIFTVFKPRVSSDVLIGIGVVLILVLGARTIIRSHDWRDQYILASKDIVASKEDYGAYDTLTAQAILQKSYIDAENYANHSISIYPSYTNNLNLGIALMNQGRLNEAARAYQTSLSYNSDNDSKVYQAFGAMTAVYGEPATNKAFLLDALNKFPQNATLWQALAILDAKQGNTAEAKTAITNAAQNGKVPQFVYDSIINDKPVTVGVYGQSVTF